MKGLADSDVVLNVLKGCRCSYEFWSFLFQTPSFKISFNLALKHTYKHRYSYSPSLFSSALFIICSLRTKQSYSIIHFSWGEENLPAASRTWPGYQRTTSNNPETDFFFLFSCHLFTQRYPDCLFFHFAVHQNAISCLDYRARNKTGSS